MDKIESMKIFIEVAKHRSFNHAAETLGYSAPAITRAVASLEGSLGVKLFHRTTRLVKLTESGARYLHDAIRIIDDIDEAEASVLGVYAKPAGKLTVTAPVLFGEKHVVPIMNEYLAAYPDVSVNAMFYDRVTSLIEEELDVAIRIGHLKDSNLYATKVGEVRRVVCGSPDYLDKHGMPEIPSDLTKHSVVFASTFESLNTWQFLNNGKKELIKLFPRLYCNHNSAALKSVLLGHGITRLMSYQAGEDINQGRLRRLLIDYEEAPLPVNVIHLEGRRANAKTRSFIELAVERLRANPLINP